MKILFIAKDFPPSIGGGQVYNREITRLLASRGHEIHVVTWTPRDGDTTEWPFRIDRLERVSDHHPCPCESIPGLLRTENPDLVLVSPTTKHLRRLYPMLEAAGIPYLVFCHFLRLKHAIRDPLRKFLARRRYGFEKADRVIAISHYLAEQLGRMGVKGEITRVIHPGVDLDHFRPDPELRRKTRDNLGLGDRPAIITVARLISGKGQDRMLDVLPKLAERKPDLAYMIVGGGPTRLELEEMVRARGLEKNVFFLGPVKDPLPFYAAADIFSLPSSNPGKWADAFGITLLESGACGLPVIASDKGGPREIIEDGSTGFLVKEDQPESLQKALLTLLENPELREKFGTAGKKKVHSTFSWSISGDRLEAVMGELRG